MQEERDEMRRERQPTTYVVEVGLADGRTLRDEVGPPIRFGHLYRITGVTTREPSFTRSPVERVPAEAAVDPSHGSPDDPQDRGRPVGQIS